MTMETKFSLTDKLYCTRVGSILGLTDTGKPIKTNIDKCFFCIRKNEIEQYEFRKKKTYRHPLELIFIKSHEKFFSHTHV